MNRNSTRKLIVTAMLVAILLILMFTGIGFIPFYPFVITLYHIPVIIAALTEGWGTGFVVSLIFGGTSLYQALTAPASIFDPLFVNPLVSILPRLLMVPTIMLARRLFGKHKKFSYAASAVAGTLANTVFTLGALSINVLVSPSSIGVAAGQPALAAVGVVWGSGAINFLPECILAVLVCTGVMTALDRIYNKKKS